MVTLRGYSLLELLIVMSIMGILLAIAAPAATEWIASQRIRDVAIDIHTSLIRARSEAVNRTLATSVTPVGGNWQDGWFIADPNSARNPDPANPTVFIERNPAVPNVTITGAGTITFTSIGRLQGGVPTGLKIVSDATDLARCIRVDTAGRPKTVTIERTATCP